MKASELMLLGVVIFIAVVAADLWMEQQRQAITQDVIARLTQPQKGPAIISGFAGVA